MKYKFNLKLYGIFALIIILMSIYGFYLNNYNFVYKYYVCEEDICQNPYYRYSDFTGDYHKSRYCDFRPDLCTKPLLKKDEVLGEIKPFLNNFYYYVFGLLFLYFCINHIWYKLYIEKDKSI